MESLSQNTGNCKSILTDLNYLGLCHMFDFFFFWQMFFPYLWWITTAFFKEYYCKLALLLIPSTDRSAFISLFPSMQGRFKNE